MFRTLFLAFAAIAELVSSAYAGDYFVDFASGSDVNPGTSVQAPWKHCPGDANASSEPAAKRLRPGDAVFFRGGIVYRGSVAAVSGAAGNPVKYIGDGWGDKRAIMDGSTPLTNSWTRCSSKADCFENPNWSNIWFSASPLTISNCLPQLIVNGTNSMSWAQDPNPSDPVFWEVLNEWHAIQPANISSTLLKDPAVLTQKDAHYWDQSLIALWVQGNGVAIAPITGYSPESSTIYFKSDRLPYTDRTCYYSFLGHPAHVDRQGEWAIRADERKMYIWPPESKNPNDLSISVGSLRDAFYLRNTHDVEISGFISQGYYQGPGNGGYGGCFVQSTGDFPGSSGVHILNNEVRMMRSYSGAPVIVLGAGTNCVAADNWVHDCVMSRGIWALGMREGTVSGNLVERINGTALYIGGSGATTSKGVTVVSNRVSNVLGIHGNGLSIYQNSEDILVSANTLFNSYTVITYESCSNVTFINNLVDCSGGDGDNKVSCWGGHYGPIRWFHNTVVMNTNGHSFFVGAPKDANGVLLLTNNIFAGMYWNPAAIIKEGYNLWTALSYQQTSLSTLDRQSTDLGVFVSPAQKNFALRMDSPAKGMGLESSKLGVLSDILSATRFEGANGDVGAFSRAPATGSRPPAPGNLLVGPGR